MKYLLYDTHLDYIFDTPPGTKSQVLEAYLKSIDYAITDTEHNNRTAERIARSLEMRFIEVKSEKDT